MDKLEINLHPLFLLFAFILIYFGWTEIFLTYLVVLVLHEYAHIFVAKKLGYKLNKVLFMPYGLSVGGHASSMPISHEVAIALSGPLLNIILTLITIAMWWCFPVVYNYTLTFVVANVSLGLTNLIPLFPLDGGRVIVASLSSRVSRLKLIKAMNAMSIIVGAVFIVLFVMSAFTKINLTYFTLGVFLISGVVSTDEQYFERVNIQNKNTAVLPISEFAVDANINPYKLVKHIKGDRYVIFYVVKDGKVVKQITEEQLLKDLDRTTS